MPSRRPCTSRAECGSPATRGPAPSGAPALPAGAVVEHDAVYRVYFHGPAYQVLDRGVARRRHVLGRSPTTCRPTTRPRRGRGSFPRLIELCFQTAGVWEIGTTGVMALPTHVDRLLRFAGADAPGAPGPSSTPRDGAAPTPTSSTRTAASGSGSRATARRAPGGLDDDALAPLRRRWDAVVTERPFRRLAIVNRGEPAMRLIHAVRELNAQRAEPIVVIALLHRGGAPGDVRAPGRRGVPRPGHRRPDGGAAAATSTTGRSSAR